MTWCEIVKYGSMLMSAGRPMMGKLVSRFAARCTDDADDSRVEI